MGVAFLLTMTRIIHHSLQKATACLILLGFSMVQSQAGGILPPKFSVQPSSTTVQNGGTAIFTTTVQSDSILSSFTWYFNGHSISAHGNINIVSDLVSGTSTLTINNVTSTNAGNYSVQVVNLLGLLGAKTSTNAALVVLSATTTNVISIVSSGTGMTTNGFTIQLSGPAGSNFVIQASTNLKNWTPISTNPAPTGSVSYTDASAKVLSGRFYRALIQ